MDKPHRTLATHRRPRLALHVLATLTALAACGDTDRHAPLPAPAPALHLCRGLSPLGFSGTLHVAANTSFAPLTLQTKAPEALGWCQGDALAPDAIRHSAPEIAELAITSQGLVLRAHRAGDASITIVASGLTHTLEVRVRKIGRVETFWCGTPNNPKSLVDQPALPLRALAGTQEITIQTNIYDQEGRLLGGVPNTPWEVSSPTARVVERDTHRAALHLDETFDAPVTVTTPFGTSRTFEPITASEITSVDVISFDVITPGARKPSGTLQRGIKTLFGPLDPPYPLPLLLIPKDAQGREVCFGATPNTTAPDLTLEVGGDVDPRTMGLTRPPGPFFRSLFNWPEGLVTQWSVEVSSEVWDQRARLVVRLDGRELAVIPLAFEEVMAAP